MRLYKLYNSAICLLNKVEVHFHKIAAILVRKMDTVEGGQTDGPEIEKVQIAKTGRSYGSKLPYFLLFLPTLVRDPSL